MKGVLILVGIQITWFIIDFFTWNGIEDYEMLFAFIGFSFLIMNICNTTFPNIAMNAGSHKSTTHGLAKEDFKSKLDSTDIEKKWMLVSKTNLGYLIYFSLNALIYAVIYFNKY